MGKLGKIPLSVWQPPLQGVWINTALSGGTLGSHPVRRRHHTKYCISGNMSPLANRVWTGGLDV
jgi:hypothetical protein